jgi:hypothetical protein
MNSETNNTNTTKSKKCLAREAKLLKRQQNQRTKEERQSEIDKVYEKLQELGITREMVGDFNKISSDYVENGYSASGSVIIPEANRKLMYLLSNDKKHQVTTLLRAI